MEFGVAWFLSVAFFVLMSWTGKDIPQEKQMVFQGWVFFAWLGLGILSLIFL